MDQTQVKCACVSKKQARNYDKERPITHEIELEVPYDQNSIYHKLSGGTNMVLRTVNDQAAAMFEIGKEYMMVIRPATLGE
jgi:hypothetical protein